MSDREFKGQLDVEQLRQVISEKYEAVALKPEQGFHFHTGRPLVLMLGYDEAWLEGIPKASVESFAGTGNPFSLGEIKPGEQVVDMGCGAGMDSLIAARMVGPKGRVIGVDMTAAMIEKGRAAAAEAGLDNVEFRNGFGEDLPVPDGWADVVISNGMLNLMPNKSVPLKEMNRVLKTRGRLQIGDILVQEELSESDKRDIDLWSG